MSLSKNELKKRVGEVLGSFKNSYLKEEGLLFHTCFPFSGNSLAHLDDIFPFLLYFGEGPFVKSQIIASCKYTYQGLVRDGERILSYQNDEYLGGLLAYYKFSRDEFTGELIKKCIEGIKHLLIKDGFVCTYYDIPLKKNSLLTSPRSGALLETLLESGSFLPQTKKLVFPLIDNWLEVPFYKKYKLFPNKYFISSPLLNRAFERCPNSLPGKLKYLLEEGFYAWGQEGYKKKIVNFIYHTPLGRKVKVMKGNTNMVHCLISAYQDSHNPKYKEAILNWVKSLKERCFKDGFIFKFWDPKKGVQEIELNQSNSVIEILCDIYYFVDTNQSHLKFAEDIANSWIKKCWTIGLLPRTPEGSFNHLDEETDFCVGLQRLHELTGEQKYRDMGEKIFDAVLRYHYTEKGYILSVDKTGKPANTIIMVRHNALLLKLFILFLHNRRIYGDEVIHDLMKDR